MAGRSRSNTSPEERLYRKRLAARLRQQRCRQRKRREKAEKDPNPSLGSSHLLHFGVVPLPSNAVAPLPMYNNAAAQQVQMQRLTPLLPATAGSTGDQLQLPIMMKPLQQAPQFVTGVPIPNYGCSYPQLSAFSPLAAPQFSCYPGGAEGSATMHMATISPIPSPVSTTLVNGTVSPVSVRHVQFILPAIPTMSSQGQEEQGMPTSTMKPALRLQPSNGNGDRTRHAAHLPPRKRMLLHLRSASEAAKIEAVDAILSLGKEQNPEAESVVIH
jgi:hypothetical protein